MTWPLAAIFLLRDALDPGGEYAYRVRGEDHLLTAGSGCPSCSTLHATNNYSTYKEFAQIINDQSKRQMTLRGLFEFKVDPDKAIPPGRS